MSDTLPALHRVLMLVNLHKDDAKEFRHQVAAFIRAQGLIVEECSFSGKAPTSPDGEYDLVVTLGGDGTVLYAARCFSSAGTPLFPINLGTLGFIAAIHKDQWREEFLSYMEGRKTPSSRLMAEIRVMRGDKEVFASKALNDVVVSAAGISKIIRLRARRGELDLGHYRADGLIIATPTGSTAYSVAAGGPILDPEMDAFIINPICPFTLSNRPLVLPADRPIQIKVEQEQRSEVIMTVDGQVVEPLTRGDVIVVRRTLKKIPIVPSNSESFYRALQSKLNWSGGPDA